MDRIAALRAFVTVVDEGGFAAAARVMGVSRSGVNRLVIALEDQLGTQLLSRSTRAVTPTSTGRAFADRARRILEDLDEAETEARSDEHHPTGTLRISAPMTFGTKYLSPLVAEFAARNPNLLISLDLNDRHVDLIEEGYDCAVRIGEAREDAHIVDFRICPMHRFLVASPAFVEAHGLADAGPDALKDLPCLHNRMGGLVQWNLTGPDGTKVRATPKCVLVANNGEVACDAAVAGVGAAMLPTFICGPALKAGLLVPVLPHYRAPPLTLAVVYPPVRHLSAKVRLFTDFVVERLGAAPPWDADLPASVTSFIAQTP